MRGKEKQSGVDLKVVTFRLHTAIWIDLKRSFEHKSRKPNEDYSIIYMSFKQIEFYKERQCGPCSG